jgi:hypothetical protein
MVLAIAYLSLYKNVIQHVILCEHVLDIGINLGDSVDVVLHLIASVALT